VARLQSSSPLAAKCPQLQTILLLRGCIASPPSPPTAHLQPAPRAPLATSVAREDLSSEARDRLRLACIRQQGVSGVNWLAARFGEPIRFLFTSYKYHVLFMTLADLKNRFPNEIITNSSIILCSILVTRWNIVAEPASMLLCLLRSLFRLVEDRRSFFYQIKYGTVGLQDRCPAMISLR
jgi:hypothetical protein